MSDAKAIYAGCSARELTDAAERRHAWDVLASRHPNLAHLAPPRQRSRDHAADCQHVSVVDYSRASVTQRP